MRRLHELRTDRDIRQQTVADYLGVSRATYANYESGKREPSLNTLKKLASFFKVSADYLLGLSQNETLSETFSAAKPVMTETFPQQPSPALNMRERHMLYGMRLLKEAGKIRLERCLDTEIDLQQQEEIQRHAHEEGYGK